MCNTTKIDVNGSMTQLQELSNALTMIYPSGVLIYKYYVMPHKLLGYLLLGNLLHLPFAFTYHLNVALNSQSNRIDNKIRRLDQTFIHISSIIYSYVLSKFNVQYMIINCVFNSISIYQIWVPKYSNDGQRWKHVAYSIILYTMPILVRGDVKNFCLSLFYMILGGVSFHPKVNLPIFRGWGHSIFHLTLGKFASTICNSLKSLF